MSIDLYYMPLSAPCRAVMLIAKALDIKVNLKYVNLMAGEQMKPEFLAINPQHCVPTMVEDDFILWESRVICTYLASKYGEETYLYPAIPKARAYIDKLLYFDMGTLYSRYADYAYPVLFHGQEKPCPKALEKVHEALGWFDKHLKNQKWAVGNFITVADFVLVATISTIEATGIDIERHRKVEDWLFRCKQGLEGYDEVNTPGLKDIAKLAKEKLLSK